MKKIIRLSCLILLLFTCNQMVGETKIDHFFRQILNSIHRIIVRKKSSKKETYSFQPQAFVPCSPIPMRFSIDDASVKLDTLITQKRAIDTEIRNEITDTLFAYCTHAKIPIKYNNKVIGICNTEGWLEDEDTKREVGIVNQKLLMLTNSNSGLDENDSGIITYNTRGFKKK